MSEPRDDKRPFDRSVAQRASADLGARIAEARRRDATAAGAETPRQKELSGMSRGFRLGSEFVAAIIVGAGLGYLVDLVLSTRPWGLIGLLLAGFAAGVLNVVRTTREMNAATAVAPGTPALDDEEDD